MKYVLLRMLAKHKQIMTLNIIYSTAITMYGLYV